VSLANGHPPLLCSFTFLVPSNMALPQPQSLSFRNDMAMEEGFIGDNLYRDIAGLSAPRTSVLLVFHFLPYHATGIGTYSSGLHPFHTIFYSVEASWRPEAPKPLSIPESTMELCPPLDLTDKIYPHLTNRLDLTRGVGSCYPRYLGITRRSCLEAHMVLDMEYREQE
jgi:hypothetical protein